MATEKEIAAVAAEALDGKKALDVKTLEIGNKTVLADYFVLATGTSSTHVNALADEAEYQLKEKLAVTPYHKEGKESWILLDYGTVIIHIFTKEAREFYKLEKLWNNADIISTGEEQ